jgi:ABC-2 type transport system permease protein
MMNWRIVGTLAGKDAALFFRSRLFAFLSLFSLAAYAGIYFFMPAAASERFTVGLYPSPAPDAVRQAFETRQMAVAELEHEAALLRAVEAGELRVGVVLPPETASDLLAGRAADVTAYYPPGVPADLNRAFNDLMVLVLNDVGMSADTRPMRITRHESVLGYDLAGRQIAPRDRLLPLFAVLLLITETLGLANLITEEVERGTLRALLITPMGLRELFAGKSLTGIGLAFLQAGFLVTITGKLGWQPLLIVAALLLGAVLVTGVGFLIAAISRDMMSVLSWGTLAIILLGLPSMSILFPGTISGWVRVIPTYYLVDTLHRVTNFQAGWGDMAGNVAALAISGAALLALGAALLERRVRWTSAA